MVEIREIYRRWLEGDLSQEDALFAIGDALDVGQEAEGDSERLAALGGDRRPAAGQKRS
jgi:hypothetical protein